MSPIIEAYLALEKARGKCVGEVRIDPEEDAILEAMDLLWGKMTATQQEHLKGLLT